MNYFISLAESINPKPTWLWILITFLGGALTITIIFILLNKKYKKKK